LQKLVDLTLYRSLHDPADGRVTFVPNDDVRSETLCPEPESGPDSVVAVRGWPAE
jgi:hypothetical protein